MCPVLSCECSATCTFLLRYTCLCGMHAECMAGCAGYPGELPTPEGAHAAAACFAGRD